MDYQFALAADATRCSVVLPVALSSSTTHRRANRVVNALAAVPRSAAALSSATKRQSHLLRLRARASLHEGRGGVF